MDAEWTGELGKPIKLHKEYKGTVYSISTKTPVEALPASNIPRTIASLGVTLAPNVFKNFLAIKNTSNENITLRLVTFNVSMDDAKDVLFQLEIKDEADVTGTFIGFSDTSEYSVNPVFTNTPIPDYPNVTIDDFGITVKNEARLNLIKDDIIVRWEAGKVLCFTALCKNANSFSFFIRHVEEF